VDAAAASSLRPSAASSPTISTARLQIRSGADAPLLEDKLAAWSIREDAFGNPSRKVRKTNHETTLIPKD
jgi:hypothetical protein